MIPICFPQEIAIGLDDGSACRCLAADPAASRNGDSIDPHRIYLALEETVQGTKQLCLNAGLAQPIILPPEVLNSFAGFPLPLPTFLEQATDSPPDKVSICLINGGGGGLGDGILFAPALDILLRRLRALAIRVIELTVCSLLPGRTSSILGGIPGVRVTAMPLSLADFLAHDAYADFSGMLTDPAFDTLHMTDFFLERMGIASQTIPPTEKEPFINLNCSEYPVVVQAALARARAEAHGKPLVAIIGISSYTRTMPGPQVATLITRLSERYRPVLIFPEGFSAKDFLTEHQLTGAASDLSAASPTFDHYFTLLAGVDAIVSVDTSAVHIGAALRKPTIALFNSIPMTTRISYSRTVCGIQLSYAGKNCHAPCGLSKSRAYVEGKLADGRTFRLECGYACDEAVDRERILTDTVASIQSLPPRRQIASELESIRQAMVSRLHQRLAPCWEALNPAAVVAALEQSIAESDRTFRQTCPICRRSSLHLRIGRYWGIDHFRCQTCRGTFADPAEPSPLPDATGQKLPSAATADQLSLAPLISSLLPVDGSLLLVGDNGDARQETAWSRLLDPAKLNERPHCFWNRRLGSEPFPRPGERYQTVVSLTCLDDEKAPDEFVATLLSYLAQGGLLIFPARNSHYIGHPVNNSRGSHSTPKFGWNRETVTSLLQLHGLEELWLGATAVGWGDIEATAGVFPSLTIQPPGHEHLSVKVDGRDLAALVSQYLAHVLQTIRDHGQYWLCCARKPF